MNNRTLFSDRLLGYEQNLPNVVILGTLGTAAVSFIISYFSLVALAQSAGMGLLGWAWPLCLDLFMIVASMFVLRRELQQESTLYGWIIVTAVTMTSVVFNILHAPDNIISQAIYALPPVVVFLSVELLMRMVRSDLRSTPEHNPHEHPMVISPVQDALPEVATIMQAVEHEPVRPVQVAHSEIYTHGQVECISTSPSNDLDEMDRSIIELYHTSPGISFSQAGRILKTSRTTLTRRVKSLVECGHLDQEVIPCYLPSTESVKQSIVKQDNISG